MSSIKPLEEMAEDVDVGDLVRINIFPDSFYVGYVWWTPKENNKTTPIVAAHELRNKEQPDFVLTMSSNDVSNWELSDRKRFFNNIKERLFGGTDSDIVLCSTYPFGHAKYLADNIQFLGINIKDEIVDFGTKNGFERELTITGYEILQKFERPVRIKKD